MKRALFSIVLAIFILASVSFAEPTEQSTEFGDQVKIVNSSNPADFKSALEVEADPAIVQNFHDIHDIMEINGKLGIGLMDNATAWYSIGSPTIYANAGDVIFPMCTQIYTDMARTSIWWDYYVITDDPGIGNIFVRLVDDSYNVLSDYVQFDSVGFNTWRARFFELPLAYIMRPSSNNIVKLEVNTSSITEYCEWFFYMIPTTVRTLPGTPYVWPIGSLEGSMVIIQTPFVQITQCPLPGQSYEPGDVNVQTMAWQYYANVPTQIHEFVFSISCDDTAALYLAWMNNQVKNFRIQCPGFTSDPLDIFEMSWMENGWVECEINDNVILPAGTTFFEVICDLDSSLSTGDYYFSLGNSAFCFGPSSIKNLNNNQWMVNIFPSSQITWGPICVVQQQVVQSELRVSLASNICSYSVVQGQNNACAVEFALQAIGSDITIDRINLAGFIQGSPSSQSLYCGSDQTILEPGMTIPGAVYVNNIAYNISIYDKTTDPFLTTNLNATQENFWVNGVAIFDQISNFVIPDGCTHILKVVFDIDSNAFTNGDTGGQGVVGMLKWVKVDFLGDHEIWAHDENNNPVYMSDQNGGTWQPGIDGNGNQNPWPVNNTSYLVQINNVGELNITAGSNPNTTNVIAGMSNVPMLNLTAQAINEAFDINKLRIFQTDSALFNRSVVNATISYQNQADSTITNTVSMVNGIADFNITATPWFIPVGQSRDAQVYFNLAPINQTYGAFTGDKVRAEFICSVNFEAKGVGGSNTALYQTSNGNNVYGNEMIVRGNVPTFIVDQYINTMLVNGLVELYRWTVTATEGGTDLHIGQLPFILHLWDTVPLASALSLSNFQILEGTSFTNATPLIQGTSGVDAYEVYGPTGEILSSPFGVIYGANPYLSTHITATFYDDRVIPAGMTKYYIFRAAAGNVNTGASSNDAVDCYMFDGDVSYYPPLAADFHPENPLWPTYEWYFGAILDDNPSTCLGNEFLSYMVLADGTGTYGNGVTIQSLFNGGPSSLDWFNGFKIKNLDVVRTLTANYDSDRSPNGEGEQGIMIELPTKFEVQPNFPNPFNAETSIQYTLPEACQVLLVIYDNLGRVVDQLVNSYQYPGYFQVRWNANRFSSGVYFYHLQAGDEVATGKMILTK